MFARLWPNSILYLLRYIKWVSNMTLTRDIFFYHFYQILLTHVGNLIPVLRAVRLAAHWTFPSEPHGWWLQQLRHAETMAEPKHRQIVDTSISCVHWKLFQKLCQKTSKILLESYCFWHNYGSSPEESIEGQLLFLTRLCPSGVYMIQFCNQRTFSIAGDQQVLWVAMSQRGEMRVTKEPGRSYPLSRSNGCGRLPVCSLLKMRDDIRGGAW